MTARFFLSPDGRVVWVYSILEGDVNTVDKPLDDGRYAYDAPGDGTVVIVNPGHPDWGTAFRPKNPLAYFLELDS